ncbi:MAG: hypothetical protein K0M47_24970, partial [Rhizobium sp.]|nr:hypothetical protein [Rhizobium sp.]
SGRVGSGSCEVQTLFPLFKLRKGYGVGFHTQAPLRSFSMPSANMRFPGARDKSRAPQNGVIGADPSGSSGWIGGG